MRLPSLFRACPLRICAGLFAGKPAPTEFDAKPCGSGFAHEEARTNNTKPKQVFLFYLWETCFHPRKEAANAAAFRTFPVRNLYS
jgi:hypothetical protein